MNEHYYTGLRKFAEKAKENKSFDIEDLMDFSVHYSFVDRTQMAAFSLVNLIMKVSDNRYDSIINYRSHEGFGQIIKSRDLWKYAICNEILGIFERFKFQAEKFNVKKYDKAILSEVQKMLFGVELTLNTGEKFKDDLRFTIILSGLSFDVNDDENNYLISEINDFDLINIPDLFLILALSKEKKVLYVVMFIWWLFYAINLGFLIDNNFIILWVIIIPLTNSISPFKMNSKKKLIMLLFISMFSYWFDFFDFFEFTYLFLFSSILYSLMFNYISWICNRRLKILSKIKLNSNFIQARFKW
ncbi:MAG: hypothetical protein MH472_09580 [Bacteroidia bacterium]|nr:hypothetical protein [Bacteroidia bacterium]